MKKFCHVKNLIQFFVMKNILNEDFDIYTNSKLLYLYLLISKTKFNFFFLMGSEFVKKSLNKDSVIYTSNHNFIEKYFYKTIDEINTDYFNKIISKYSHYIFFNKYTIINSLIYKHAKDNNKKYSCIEINNLEYNFKVQEGEKININTNYSFFLMKNKYLKILIFFLDIILLNSNSFYKKFSFFYNIKYIFSSFVGFLLLNLVNYITKYLFKNINHKKYNEIIIMQCSHDSSILCESKMQFQEYFDTLIKNYSKNCILSIHPEERGIRAILYILKFCIKNKATTVVSINNLKNFNFDKIYTLSSSAQYKLIK